MIQQAAACGRPIPSTSSRIFPAATSRKSSSPSGYCSSPRVLLLDEPTRGVDIGAKEEIYHLIEQAAEAGAAVLFASSELPEVLGLADRILVMHEGRLAGEISKAQANEEAVMRLATGEHS